LLLANVAKRLKNCVRESDVVSRFGGDEFAVVVGDVIKIEQVIDLVERIQQSLSMPFILDGRRIFSSSSIGIAMSNSGYENADDIIRDADIAMYYAKEHGEIYSIFDQTMHTKVVNLMETESDLRYALERNEFCLHYQPIIKLDSTELTGFEALIRWNHPTRGLVSPAEFIPLSEETGLIIPMTFWVIREVCEQIIKWQKMSGNKKLLTISVNISGKHFAETDLVEQIEQILSETKVNPLSLKLEITESAVMANAENAIDMLKRLKRLGLQLSIDDFGTGYSSLSYLHRFPTDTLKVDRSFVNKMKIGSDNSEIVKTIVSLAKALNMKVVAEGIETAEQLQLLQDLDCEYGQGFLFSRPVPKDEAEILWITEKNWEEFLPIDVDYTETQFQLPQLESYFQTN
jgi:EAL domain-containing protein (putative c-di-GMP-specific phosphodiesterase class I)